MNKLLRIFYTTKNLLVMSHFDKDFIKSSILLINILPRANIENILSCSFNKEIVLETIKSITHDYNLIINEYIENHIDPYIKYNLRNKRYTTDFYRATAGQRGALIFFSIVYYWG
ncbi:hypothetical protein ACI0FM_14895 [Paenochrobactrum sp. BZR 588]|uniref:hypothetical protein n=1 Tax=unclassified Paenochrobactrum TaxID=2639760 RepID=UPI0038539403